MTARFAAGLSGAERTRLVRLLGMTGSDHAGEVANAARMADAFIKTLGLRWEDVIAAGALASPPDFLLDWPTRWRGAAMACQQVGGLTEKQRAFLTNIVGYQNCPSPRQLQYLRAIMGRVLVAGGTP